MSERNKIRALWPTLFGEFHNTNHKDIKKDLINFFEDYKFKNPMGRQKKSSGTENFNLYESKYDLHRQNNNVYDELTNYDESLFNNEISMIKPGRYSSHYFESNYSDLSDNVTKDFKYFYSTAPTIAGYGLFNKR